MFRVGRWLGERTRSSNSVTSNLDAAAEAQNMEVALRAAELIMDDNIPGAEAALADGDSAFHKLAKGTLGFMKATLGFEQDMMKEAIASLSEAESSAYAFHQKAQHDPQAFSSTIYERGSEFALCQAEAQIMSAVVGVLNESLTESLKGFYKMRKAYLTLEGLAQQEANFMKTRALRGGMGSRQMSNDSLKSARSVKSVKSLNKEMATIPEPQIAVTAPSKPSALRTAQGVDGEKSNSSDSDNEFFENEDAHEKNATYRGRTDRPGPLRIDSHMQHLAVSPAPSSLPSGATTPVMESPNASKPDLLTADADSDVFTNSLDIFIHSGVNLMSGLINLMLSVIPPAFGRLLSIIGFRGDRERGLKMLWQASKFHNINGGMAGLILFGWYNGIIGFCDIITDSDPNIVDDVNGFPAKRLENLLAVMRQRYPKSFLWKLEEARSYSNARNIDKAIDILSGPEKAQMKQLEALHIFERSVDSMNAHRYELCAKSFIECVELNQWSQALYYYAAASAHLQIYRDFKDDSSKAEEVEEHRALAEKYFKHAPTCIGKKKMMGRQLPFDGFVVRKIAKWTERATAWNCTLIEAAGVAPIEEIVMLWNGYKKMNETQLQKSLSNITWSHDASRNPHAAQMALEPDESHISNVLRAMVFRNLRDHTAAQEALAPTLTLDANTFKTPKDDWMGPVAHYEMAVNYWMQRREYTSRYGTTISGMAKDSQQVTESDIEFDKSLVAQARRHVERAKGWGSYELETRIGMKVTAGFAAVGKWEAKHAAK